MCFDDAQDFTVGSVDLLEKERPCTRSLTSVIGLSRNLSRL